MKIGVVGSGVVGLTCAERLAGKHEVSVLHDRPLMSTTSAIATAIWHVYLLDPSDQQNVDWSAQTLAKLLQLSAETPAAGVELVEGVELFRRGAGVRPTWADHAIGFRMLGQDELQARYPGIAWGYEIAAPTVDMAVYLPWLHGECLARGVQFSEWAVEDLRSLLGEFDLVLNCTGIAARELTDDDSLFGVRGQYFVLNTGPNTPSTYIGDDEHPDGMAYLIPRAGQVLIGGTEELTEELVFDIDESELRARSTEFAPDALDGTQVQERVVGIRPCRKGGTVRFGPDPDESGLFHNYGHGGSGFSLSWGCAQSVVEWIEESQGEA